jgi:eukaryotic-like serine/threonine-protein kinase
VEAGTVVGGYRVIEPLGAGGMGAVWMAEHAILGRRAALKMLKKEYAARPDMVTRFFNEARAATSIADPGIVQIFDFGYHEGCPYIAMELLLGEPLDVRLRGEGRLPALVALRIVRQVAASLGAAHAANIVHRDLKPENIFLVRDPEITWGERAKILDFGIAKLGESTGVRTETAVIMGTPLYMSPEQCRGAGAVDARADVYSLGCVLFVLLTGRPPFTGRGGGEIIAKHQYEPAPRVSSFVPVSPKIDALVERCLAKQPEVRFASGTQLAQAIDELLALPGVHGEHVPHRTEIGVAPTLPTPGSPN